MGCLLNDGDLVAYHLGTAGDAERERLESHLVECPGCAQAYVKLKRHFEHAPGARPSDALRRQLRAEVEAAFRPALPRRFGSWLRRPIPLYQGMAAALLVAVALGLAIWAPSRAAERPHSTGLVDSARQEALSFSVF
ncbi:MAG: zf-HC2 domain-containing protein [Polyangiaceae bacterium]|jgi:anti-sigma factor RsiW|nr:zf-HC2 domain-containing protein [Polyangiaceae bacterium]